MPTRDTAPSGAPCWIDLLSRDVDAAIAFYTALFGWDLDDPGPDYGGYKNFAKDGVMVAGLMRGDGSMPAGFWSLYLKTDDIDTTVRAAAARGATIVLAPHDVQAKVRFAMLADPGGAEFGVWQPGGHEGFGVYDEPDTPGWFELHTPDYVGALDFYRHGFGWTTSTESDTPEFRYTTVRDGDEQLAGVMDQTGHEGADQPARWAVYFRVASTDATARRITELGGTIVMAPEDTPYGRLAVATDPTGARFSLVGA